MPNWVRFTSIALLAGLVSVSAEGDVADPSGSVMQEPQEELALLGEQFQVNTYTLGNQERVEVAVDLDGDFVVVWDSQDGGAGNDTDNRSIQAQLYLSDGTPLGSEFQINNLTPRRQDHPSVAMFPDGDFVVVWRSLGSVGNDSNNHAVQGQRFASDGTQIGAQFQVNTYTYHTQERPAVAAEADGDFVVVWYSQRGSGGDDSSYGSIQGQRFASDGTPAGAEFQVNAYTNRDQIDPSVAIDLDGGFVVVWESDDSDNGGGTRDSIQGQRFASDGMPMGSQFLVNSQTELNQNTPDISIGLDGDFVVAWDNSLSVQSRRFASDGTALGDQITVNSFQVSNNVETEVSMGLDGSFVIVWDSEESPGDDDRAGSVQGRLFASDGTPEGSQFQINTEIRGQQIRPAVAMRSGNDFVAVWESDRSSGTDDGEIPSNSAQGRVLCTLDCVSFIDGFESGDTMAWSTSVGEIP